MDMADFFDNFISPFKPLLNIVSPGIYFQTPQPQQHPKVQQKLPPTNVKTPALRKRPIRIVQKIHYETLPNAYLVEYQKDEGGKKKFYRKYVHEGDGKISTQCRELIRQFNEKVAKDPNAYPPEYQVKAILDRTIENEEDEILYLIKWVGWNEPTWEKKHYLMEKYAKLVAEFDAINGIKGDTHLEEAEDEPMEKKRKKELNKEGEGIEKSIILSANEKVESPKKVPEAIQVLTKIDKGPKIAPTYLVEWPCEVKRAQAEPFETIGTQTWEKHISIGTKKAIRKFEWALKRGAKSANKRLHFEIQRIMDKRVTKKTGKVEYLAKFHGHKRKAWINPQESVHSSMALLVQFELRKAKKISKFEGKYFEAETIPIDAVEEFYKIFGRNEFKFQ